MDVLPVLPLEFLVVIFKSMWYLTMLNVLKLMRLRVVLVYARRLYYVSLATAPFVGLIARVRLITGDEIFQVYRINFHLYKIAEIGVIIVMCVHWAACLEYYLPLIVIKITGQDEELVIKKNC